MRWYWIDRFEEFVSGRRAVAVKNVSLGEEQVDGYLPHMPHHPPSLIIEGLAQTGGLLVGEHNGFRERVVLAKVGRAVFHDLAFPGTQLRYTAELQTITPGGAMVRGTSHAGDRLQAEIDLVFAHLGNGFRGDLFDPWEFYSMLRIFGLYRVGRRQDGSPLEVPPQFRDAEQAALAEADGGR